MGMMDTTEAQRTHTHDEDDGHCRSNTTHTRMMRMMGTTEAIQHTQHTHNTHMMRMMGTTEAQQAPPPINHVPFSTATRAAPRVKLSPFVPLQPRCTVQLVHTFFNLSHAHTHTHTQPHTHTHSHTQTHTQDANAGRKELFKHHPSSLLSLGHAVAVAAVREVGCTTKSSGIVLDLRQMISENWICSGSSSSARGHTGEWLD
jgi:hypothetical protein